MDASAPMRRIRLTTVSPLPTLKIWLPLPQAASGGKVIGSIDDLKRFICKELFRDRKKQERPAIRKGDITLEVNGFEVLGRSDVRMLDSENDVVCVRLREEKLEEATVVPTENEKVGKTKKRKILTDLENPKLTSHKKQKTVATPAPPAKLTNVSLPVALPAPPAILTRVPLPVALPAPPPPPIPIANHPTSSVKPAQRARSRASSSSSSPSSSDSGSINSDSNDGSSSSDDDSSSEESIPPTPVQLPKPTSQQPMVPSPSQSTFPPPTTAPSAPPGKGSSATKERNARRRALRKAQKQAGKPLLEAVRSVTASPAKPTGQSQTLTVSEGLPQVKVPKSIANKNKKRGFMNDGAKMVGTKTIFEDIDMDESLATSETPPAIPTILPVEAVTTATRTPGPRLHFVVPSELNHHPHNLIVSSQTFKPYHSTGAGSAQRRDDRRQEELSWGRHLPIDQDKNEMSEEGWTTVESHWESLKIITPETVGKASTVGNLVAWKALELDLTTFSPEIKLKIGKVVESHDRLIRLRKLGRPPPVDEEVWEDGEAWAADAEEEEEEEEEAMDNEGDEKDEDIHASVLFNGEYRQIPA